MKRERGMATCSSEHWFSKQSCGLAESKSKANCQGGEVGQWVRGSPSTVGSQQHCTHHHTGTHAWKKKGRAIFLHFGGYLNGISMARAPGEKGKSLAGPVPV